MFTVIFDLKEWITSFAGRRGPGWTKRGRDAVLTDEERLGVEGAPNQITICAGGGGVENGQDIAWQVV